MLSVDAARRRRTAMLIGWFLGVAGVPILIQMLITQVGAMRAVLAALVVALSVMGPGAALLARAGRGTAAGLWLSAIPTLGAVAAVFASRQIGAAPFYCGVGLLVALATLEGRALWGAIGGVIASVAVMVLAYLFADLQQTQPAQLLLGSVVASVLMAAVAFMHARAFRRTLEAVADQQHRAAELEAKYRLIAENTDDLVELIDASNRVVYASPSFVRLLGVDPTGTIAGTSIGEGTDSAPMQTLFEQARAGQPARCEGTRRRVDGTMLRFEGAVTKVAGTELLLVVARDVTTERAMAADLEHAKKMEALGRFAGSIAHDFNNLLSVMRSCTTLASQALPRDSSAHADLNDVQDAISRASELTAQLLAFSRRDVVVPTRVDVAPALGRMAELARRLVGPAVRVEVDVSPDTWSMWCGPGQLDQIVMNLAANARDAMPQGGRLTLAAKNAPTSPIGEAVLLTVTDTGTGISPEARRHLFEPFFTTKAPGIGTGLGLATVFSIVKALGGVIDVASEEGKGTEFRIWLPRVQAGAETKPPLLAPPHRQRSPHEAMVLVVDDDADVRSQMVRIIAHEGFQVLSAADAEQALALTLGLSELPVLVTDVMLPGKDGLWLSQRLLERFPSLRVVLVSGFTPDPRAATKLIDQGARFLEKPFRPVELAGAVRESLGLPPPPGEWADTGMTEPGRAQSQR